MVIQKETEKILEGKILQTIKGGNFMEVTTKKRTKYVKSYKFATKRDGGSYYLIIEEGQIVDAGFENGINYNAYWNENLKMIGEDKPEELAEIYNMLTNEHMKKVCENVKLGIISKFKKEVSGLQRKIKQLQSF